MKKSVYISNFLLILMVLSCGQNSSEKKLNGNWREIDDEYSTWHFYPDSLVFKIKGNTQEKVNWNGNKSEIKFDIQTSDWNSDGKIVDTTYKVGIDYQLSNKGDSLFITFTNNYGTHKLSLLKTKNYVEYLKRKFGIEFTLPNDSSAKYLDRPAFQKKPNGYNLYPIYGMRIFMGISDGQVVGKTEISESLNNLKLDIKKFKDSIKPYEQHQIETHAMFLDRRFHLRIFADKNISDSTITNHLKTTIYEKNSELDKHYPERFRGQKRDTLPIRIYRIVDRESINPHNLYGREIKTIANTVYN